LANPLQQVRLLPFRRYPNPFPFLGGADIGQEILTILVEVKQSLRLPIEGASFLLLDPRDFSQLDEKRLNLDYSRDSGVRLPVSA